MNKKIRQKTSLLLFGWQPKWKVQRTKADKTGKQKDNAQNQQDQSECAGDGTGVIENANENGSNDPDRFVDGTRGLFHRIQIFLKLTT